MNSKQVLDKILALLSIDKKEEEVKMTYAKLKDGTIVESATFDVGEALDVVTEDGKTPAPDGEHELSLRDSSGNETLIKVITKDGKIVERENVELEAETEDVKDIPEVDGVIGKEKKAEEMAEEEPLDSEDGVEEEVDPILEDEETVTMKKMYEDMSYRITELEKKIAKMEEIKEEIEEEMEEEEDSTPKLDGAPIEEVKMSNILPKQKNKVGDAQNSFLSKLYK
jgi:hypothetical protein